MQYTELVSLCGEEEKVLFLSLQNVMNEGNDRLQCPPACLLKPIKQKTYSWSEKLQRSNAAIYWNICDVLQALHDLSRVW